MTYPISLILYHRLHLFFLERTALIVSKFLEDDYRGIPCNLGTMSLRVLYFDSSISTLGKQSSFGKEQRTLPKTIEDSKYPLILPSSLETKLFEHHLRPFKLQFL